MKGWWPGRQAGSDPAGPDDEFVLGEALDELSQVLGNADQLASDRDADDASSDGDLGRLDAASAEADQAAADADQAASDRDLAVVPNPSADREAEHRASRKVREGTSRDRDLVSHARAEGEEIRNRSELHRQETAMLRDEVAAERDRAADLRDGAARRVDQALLAADPSNIALREAVAAHNETRDQARRDRQRAANDRHRAAEDRLNAIAAERQARIAVQRAQLDDETGVFAKDLGHATLRNEIDRCRRSADPFVLAHLAIAEPGPQSGRQPSSTALVAAVVHVLRHQLRSYDPVVRVGDHEFLCGLPGTRLELARERLDDICAAVAAGRGGGVVSVGFAVLEDGDSLGSLVDRCQADLDRERRRRH